MAHAASMSLALELSVRRIERGTTSATMIPDFRDDGKTKGRRGGSTVITTRVEYEKAQSELRDLQERLAQLQRDHPIGEKGFTKAGIRKLIARLNEELAVFEGSEEARSSPST